MMTPNELTSALINARIDGTATVFNSILKIVMSKW